MKKQEILNDYNLLSSLEFQELTAFLIWRGGPCSYVVFLNDVVLFEGDKFKPSPLHYIDSPEAICSMLGFITVKEEDTDPDYFKDYTPAQIEFTQSNICEQLSGLLSDFSDKNGEYYKAAKKQIKKAFKAY